MRAAALRSRSTGTALPSRTIGRSWLFSRPAAVLGFDQAHGQCTGDIAVPVADKDCAELQPALKARHRGSPRLGVMVGPAQIIAASVRRDHDRAGRNGLWGSIAGRRVVLRA